MLRHRDGYVTSSWSESSHSIQAAAYRANTVWVLGLLCQFRGNYS